MACDFETRRAVPRDDLFASMANVAGVRETRREHGQDKVKLMFIFSDVDEISAQDVRARAPRSRRSARQSREANRGLRVVG